MSLYYKSDKAASAASQCLRAFYLLVAKDFINSQKSIYPLHPRHALHMDRVDGIDVCGAFFIASVRGNMSMVFRSFLRKHCSWEHINN
jgi:hypothetical protein